MFSWWASVKGLCGVRVCCLWVRGRSKHCTYLRSLLMFLLEERKENSPTEALKQKQQLLSSMICTFLSALMSD
jgi:hypothetical protein